MVLDQIMDSKSSGFNPLDVRTGMREEPHAISRTPTSHTYPQDIVEDFYRPIPNRAAIHVRPGALQKQSKFIEKQVFS